VAALSFSELVFIIAWKEVKSNIKAREKATDLPASFLRKDAGSGPDAEAPLRSNGASASGPFGAPKTAKPFWTPRSKKQRDLRKSALDKRGKA